MLSSPAAGAVVPDALPSGMVNLNGTNTGSNGSDPFSLVTESRSFVLPTGIQILMCLLYGTLAFTAITSNMIVCYIVLSNQRMRTATNYFIVNLAVGDILMALFCIPFTFPANLIFLYWPFGFSLCVIVSYSQANSVFISAYTMVAISIDKYLAIVYPMRLRMPKIEAKIIILVIWSAALLTSLPTALLSSLSPASLEPTTGPDSGALLAQATASEPLVPTFLAAKGLNSTSSPPPPLGSDYGARSAEVAEPQVGSNKQWASKEPPITGEQQADLEQRKYFCQESWTFWPKGKYYYSMALMILQFVLPLFVLVITYSRIVIIVWGKRMPGEEDNARDARMARSKRKMIKMVIFCVIAFALTWLPFNALIVIGDMHPDIWENPNIMYIWFITHYLAMCHTITNPLIYIWMNNRFRAGFKQVIGNLYRPSRAFLVHCWFYLVCLACFLDCSRRKHAQVMAGFVERKNRHQLTSRGSVKMNTTYSQHSAEYGVCRMNSSLAPFFSPIDTNASSNSAPKRASFKPTSVALESSNCERLTAPISRGSPRSSSRAATSCRRPDKQSASSNFNAQSDPSPRESGRPTEADCEACDKSARFECGQSSAGRHDESLGGQRKRKRTKQSHVISINMTTKEYLKRQPDKSNQDPIGEKHTSVCEQAEGAPSKRKGSACPTCLVETKQLDSMEATNRSKEFVADMRQSSQSTATISTQTNTTSLAISPINSARAENGSTASSASGGSGDASGTEEANSRGRSEAPAQGQRRRRGARMLPSSAGLQKAGSIEELAHGDRTAASLPTSVGNRRVTPLEYRQREVDKMANSFPTVRSSQNRASLGYPSGGQDGPTRRLAGHGNSAQSEQAYCSSHRPNCAMLVAADVIGDAFRVYEQQLQEPQSQQRHSENLDRATSNGSIERLSDQFGAELEEERNLIYEYGDEKSPLEARDNFELVCLKSDRRSTNETQLSDGTSKPNEQTDRRRDQFHWAGSNAQDDVDSNLVHFGLCHLTKNSRVNGKPDRLLAGENRELLVPFMDTTSEPAADENGNRHRSLCSLIQIRDSNLSQAPKSTRHSNSARDTRTLGHSCDLDFAFRCNNGKLEEIGSCPLVRSAKSGEALVSNGLNELDLEMASKQTSKRHNHQQGLLVRESPTVYLINKTSSSLLLSQLPKLEQQFMATEDSMVRQF